MSTESEDSMLIESFLQRKKVKSHSGFAKEEQNHAEWSSAF
jgi:hypothetical protein